MIKQAFPGDGNALSQDIARGNYEHLSAGGSIVLPIVGENLDQPGWKLKMQMKNTQREIMETNHEDNEWANGEGSHEWEEKENEKGTHDGLKYEDV